MNTFIDFHHSLALMVDVVVCLPDALRNEFFDASNDLHGKRVIPMRFALIDRVGSPSWPTLWGSCRWRCTGITTVVNT